MLLTVDPPVLEQETLRVSALHALCYCPRLFYLEEVEELYTQDAAVFAGRRLHEELARNEDEDWEELNLESSELGLRGRVDALRTREGQVIPYEHKRGRCYRSKTRQAEAWESDRIQVLAYAMLIESALGVEVPEGRVRYHADNVLVRVPLDAAGRAAVQAAIAQARQLRQSPQRPPVAENERLCVRCSLAPVCLPEESRLAHNPDYPAIRMFPRDDEREILHVLQPGSSVGKSGEQIKIAHRGEAEQKLPARQVGQIVIHSFSQISTQALHLCAAQEIGVHFISGSGHYIGSFDTRQGSIQRRIGQYRALCQPDVALTLARKLVTCRGQSQRKFLMRGQRGLAVVPDRLRQSIDQMQALLKQIDQADQLDTLLGIEGKLAQSYFAALPDLLSEAVPPELQFSGRNRRPPKDRFNAMLGFGYAMLLKDVMNGILAVGLEPSLGFYHQPRTQAPPLALDLMEIFRVPLVDMPIVASVNRQQWQVQDHFEARGDQVWLSESGKRQLIEIYERRKQERWKHPVTNYSLSYSRLIELEVRLLEKEWSGDPGLFGQLVIR